MTDAERLFNQICKRWIDSQGFILSFRIMTNQGTEAAREKVREEKVRFVANLIQQGEYDKLFPDKMQQFFNVMPPEKLVEVMTESTVRQAQQVADAASIVLAHSFLDGAAFDYCRVIALAAPHDWEGTLDQRQIRLSEARELGYEQMLKRKLDEFLEQLERESLLKKADLLFARCQPPDKWNPIKDYSYHRGRLEYLDNYRHEVIHGDGLGKDIANASEEVEYLSQTVMFFQALVNRRYHLRLDPFYALTGKEISELQSPPAAKAQE
jgi:hypothetical protein